VSTKYYGIETTTPTYALPGQKGARNVNNLEKIFPKPFGNTVGTSDGTQEGSFKADGKSVDPVDTSNDVTYQTWFLNHVVNGVVQSKWLADTAGGSSAYSMNYVGAPSMQLGTIPLKATGIDGTGQVIVGTNQFVPVLVTQADSKTGHLTPGSANADAVKITADNFISKASGNGAPGSGPSAGSPGRNPANTSASQQASNNKTLTLGKFLIPAK